MLPATLLGWAFPDLPASARLVHVEARVALPAAGANVNMDGPSGTSGYGGTGYLFARRRYESGTSQRRCRLLAAGFGLADAWRTIPATASVPATSSVGFGTLFGLVDPWVARSILLQGSGAGLVVRQVTGPANLLTIPTAEPSTRLDRVHVHGDLEIYNGTGGALTVRGLATVRPEAARFNVRCIVTRRQLNAASPPAVVRSVLMPTLETGSEVPAYLEDGQAVQLVPVAADESAQLGQDEGFGVNVSHAAGGTIPASAVVVARLLVATWADAA